MTNLPAPVWFRRRQKSQKLCHCVTATRGTIMQNIYSLQLYILSTQKAARSSENSRFEEDKSRGEKRRAL